MGFLDSLVKNLKDVGVHQGSTKIFGVIPTPDFSISESIADAKAIPRDANGGSQNWGDYTPNNNNTQKIVNSALQQRAVNTANRNATTNTGGNGGGTVNNPSPGTNLNQNENDNYNARVKASQGRLNALIDNIRYQMGQADTTRDYLKQSANDMYYGNTTDEDTTNDTGLFGLSKNKRDSSLKALADELTGVTNEYEGIDGQGGLIKGNRDNQVRMNDELDRTNADTLNTYSASLGSNAKAVEGAMARNRVRARASGIGSSSFFDTAQNNTENTGLSNAGNLLSEQANKVAGIASDRGENNQWYEQKDVGLKNEMSGKKTAINTRTTDTTNYFDKFDLDLGNELKGNLQTIDDDWQKTRKNLITQEQIYGINNEEELANLDYEHQQNLNAITEYVMNKQNVRDALATQAKGQSSKINSYNAVDDKTRAVLADRTQANDMGRKTISDMLSSTLANNNAVENSGNTDYNSVGANSALLDNSTLASLTNSIKNRFKKGKSEEEDPFGYFLNSIA